MFYIFHGNDEYSQRETLESLTAKLGDPDMVSLNTTWLQGSRLALPALRDACDALPFLAPARLVIVEDFFSRSPARDLVDSVLTYLPQVPETTRLVFLERQALPVKHSALRLASTADNGYAKEFAPLQGSSLERWIRERVAGGGGEITPRAAHLLAANINGDLRVMVAEVEKLTLYKANDGPIDVADVELLCPYVAEASIFDLVDALGARRGQRAAQLLQKKLSEGADPFYLFSMIVRQFRLLIQAKALAESDVRPPDIAAKLQVPGFVANKIARQCQQFSLEQLKQIYAHLLDMDVAAKTGRMDMETGLSLLVAGIT